MIKNQELLKIIVHFIFDSVVMRGQVFVVLELSNVLEGSLIVRQHEGLNNLVFHQSLNCFVPLLIGDWSVSGGRPVLEDTGVAWLLAVFVKLASWTLEVVDAGWTLGGALGVDIVVETTCHGIQQSTWSYGARKLPWGVVSGNGLQRFL